MWCSTDDVLLTERRSGRVVISASFSTAAESSWNAGVAASLMSEKCQALFSPVTVCL